MAFTVERDEAASALGSAAPLDRCRYFLVLGDRVYELLFQPTRRCFRPQPSGPCRCCTVIGRPAEEVARPILWHNRSGTCWHPHVKRYTPMVNSIYNGLRMEDVWLDR
jgi:hypothetical protein